ncbi:MAG: sodium/solute symporter [Candidatus Latescibacteria bacterium]|nr:sodium/solute symporter [Candidatus Latescibacterota bacterium]
MRKVLNCISHILIFAAVIPGCVLAEEPLLHETIRKGGLQALDWLMIGIYAGVILGIGWAYSRKQTSTEEYFLCSRNMGSFIIGISLTASILSTISYLSKPGEMIKYGPTDLWSVVAIPLYYFAVAYLIIPAFMKLRITSAYELLETHIGLSVRLCGALIFILTRLSWMALLIYLASKSVVVMFGWPASVIPYVVIATGLVSVLYTTIGGLRAVVVTDMLQFFTLMAGALFTMAIITIKMGGVGEWWPDSWMPNWKPQPLFSFDLHVRATVTGAIVYPTAYWLCTAGSDQMAIQRYLSTRDVKTARRAFLITSLSQAVIIVLLAITGMALLGFYRSVPSYRALGDALYTEADYLFPNFIATYLPAGIAGLVVSGIFAAAMSSVDSGINSVVSIISVDFIDRFKRHEHTKKHDVSLAKYLVLGIGVAIVLISAIMDKVPGNITEVTSKTNGLFVGPLFGLFFMALFVPYASSFGTIIGAYYGLLAAGLVAYWDVLTGDGGLSFQWITAISLVVHIFAGVLLSLLPVPENRKYAALWWIVGAITPLVVGAVLIII